MHIFIIFYNVHDNLGWFTYHVGCQLHDSLPLIRTPAGWSGAGILLSSDTSDNLLLFVTVEGPKTDLLAVTSFPKAWFLRPFSIREWKSSQCRCLGYQRPCIWRVLIEQSSNKIEWSVMSLPVSPGAFQIPHTCHADGYYCQSKSPPCTDPQLADEKSPHHYPCHCLHYLQRTLAQCSQLLAQCAIIGLVTNLRLSVQRAFRPCPRPSACNVI